MAASLTELHQQRDALARQIRDLQADAKADAIVEVKRLMTEHGLTVADLSGRSVAPSPDRPNRTVAPKYRDPESGLTWSGRGLKPKWLQAAIANGRSPEDFAI